MDFSELRNPRLREDIKSIFGTSGSPRVCTYDGNKVIEIYTTCASVNASVSYEPILFHTTLTGIGQVGGRVRAFMTTNVALGGWSNAFKAEVTYGASGRTAGLGSALCAEMTMSAGCSSGTYAPLEVELNMGAAGVTGTATSLIFMSVNDAKSTVFDDHGFLFTLQGVASGAAHVFYDKGSAITGDIVGWLRVKTPSGTQYLPLYDSLS